MQHGAVSSRSASVAAATTPSRREARRAIRTAARSRHARQPRRVFEDPAERADDLVRPYALSSAIVI
jgi:hypothetical protein